jgi:hypothetical protein
MVKPVILLLLPLTLLGWKQERTKPSLALRDSQMFIEWAPAKEAVVRITAENEDDLGHVRIFRPDGQELLDVDTSGRGGLASLDLELREPDLRSLLDNYLAGSYVIRAYTADGRLFLGQASLSLDLPSAPRVLYPRTGEIVPSGLTVSWLAENGVSGYEVKLEQGEEDGLRVRLPPKRSSFQVPRDFLRPATATTLEVTAIGANGNRTVTEISFLTRP